MKTQCVPVAAMICLAAFAGPAVAQTSPAADDPVAGADLAMVTAPPSRAFESSYVRTVHAALDRAKRYPTGREASLTRPSGAADVWFELSREGVIQAVGIERSSGSLLLDATARSLVRRAVYPAFPADAWPGAQSRRFAVSYAFTGEQGTAVRQLETRTAAR